VGAEAEALVAVITVVATALEESNWRVDGLKLRLSGEDSVKNKGLLGSGALAT
jgi:hypothetical protein